MIKLIDSASIPFDDWSNQLIQLHLSNSDPISAAQRLAYLNLIRKAATFTKLSTTNHDLIPKGYIVKEWSGLLHHMFHKLQYDLIYEYCAILLRRNSCLPINILIETISSCNLHPTLAQYIVPVLGETGYFICNKNKEWHWLHPDFWNNPIRFKDSAQKMFTFEMYYKQHPNEATAYFFKNILSWTEKELALSCTILLKNIRIEHEQLITDALRTLSNTSGLHLYRLLFQLEDHEITKKIKLEFDQKFHVDQIEHIEIPMFKKSKKPLEVQKIIGILPPSWIISSPHKIDAYKLLIKHELVADFIHTISKYNDESSALDFSHFLIDQKLFTEHIPIEKISALLNYETFNQLALYWINCNKGDIDLEAFLTFIRIEKHFWSDELLLAILNFSEYKRLVKEYNLEVFLEKIPYKINPNSKQLGKIHKQIQFSEDPHFDFDQIIKFRQDLRK